MSDLTLKWDASQVGPEPHDKIARYELAATTGATWDAGTALEYTIPEDEIPSQPFSMTVKGIALSGLVSPPSNSLAFTPPVAPANLKATVTVVLTTPVGVPE
jgi:hypothetical protein